jgi:hypothetical protein
MAKKIAKLSIPHDDRVFEFTLTVEDGLVTAAHPDLGSKTTQVGNSPWDVIGAQLARELIREKGRSSPF